MAFISSIWNLSPATCWFSDLSSVYAVCSDTVGSLLSASSSGGIVLISGTISCDNHQINWDISNLDFFQAPAPTLYLSTLMVVKNGAEVGVTSWETKVVPSGLPRRLWKSTSMIWTIWWDFISTVEILIMIWKESETNFRVQGPNIQCRTWERRFYATSRSKIGSVCWHFAMIISVSHTLQDFVKTLQN